MSSRGVKQNSTGFPQNPAFPPPFRDPFSITELQKGDEILSREPEHISKLRRYIDLSQHQLRPEPPDHCVERAPVVIAIRLHLDDSTLPLQKSKQSRDRATVTRDKLSNARWLLLASANIMRQVVTHFYVPLSRGRLPTSFAYQRSI